MYFEKAHDEPEDNTDLARFREFVRALATLLLTNCIDCTIRTISIDSKLYRCDFMIILKNVCNDDDDPFAEFDFWALKRLINLQTPDHPTENSVLSIQELLDDIKPSNWIDEVQQPDALTCTLFPFQRRAVAWMLYRETEGHLHIPSMYSEFRRANGELY